MTMVRLVTFLLGSFLAAQAFGQTMLDGKHAVAQQPSLAERNLAALTQQLQPAILLFAEDQQKQITTLRKQLEDLEKQNNVATARIADLEKMCGDVCKK